MKKISLIVLFFCAAVQLYGSTLGIGVITDFQTKLSKSFAFYDLFSKNKLTRGADVLIPGFVDFVYLSDYALEGTVYESSVDLKLYRKGELQKNIRCNNDWETIFKEISAELMKSDAYFANGKFIPVNEGKKERFYSKKIEENLPGRLTVQVPKTTRINFSSFKARIISFDVVNAYTEIIQIYGKYGKADINEVAMLNNHMVPADFKFNVRALFYPVSNTVTYSLKMLGYGAYLSEKNDYAAALNCYYTALNTSENIMCSIREKAMIRAFAFKGISDIYASVNGRNELSKLFGLGYEINYIFSNSPAAYKEQEAYYEQIRKVTSMCMDVQRNLQMMRSAVMMQAMSAVGSSLSTSFSSLGVDVSSLNSLSQYSGQGDQMMQQSADFFNQLSQAKDVIDVNSFKTEDVDISHEYNIVSKEILGYLLHQPEEVKSELLRFSKDKPLLNKLLTDFYQSDAEDKKELIKKVYAQMYKIELITVALEAKGKTVDEHYKSIF